MINKKKIALIALLCCNFSLASAQYFDYTKPSAYGNVFYNFGISNANQLLASGASETAISPIGLGIGFIYDTGQNFRLELEGLFSGKGSINGPSVAADSNLSGAASGPINFKKSYFSGLLNAYYNIHSDYQVSSYFGIGVGFSRLAFSDSTRLDQRGDAVGHDAAFNPLNALTMQFKAGLVMDGVSDHLIPYAGYRLLCFTGQDITYTLSKQQNTISTGNGIIEHNIQAGVMMPLNLEI